MQLFLPWFSPVEKTCAEWPADLLLQIAIHFMYKHTDKAADDCGLTERLEKYIEADNDA